MRVLFGRDNPESLILCWDGGSVFEDNGFYIAFNKLNRNNMYQHFLMNKYYSNSNHFKIYQKNDDYNLEDCIVDFLIKVNKPDINFPYYILKNDYWYIIKNNEFILEFTGISLLEKEN